MARSDFDVIIVGSGAGGGASAWALCRHRVRVLVLEAGPSYNPGSDYLLDKPHWEQAKFPDRAQRKGRYTFGPMQRLEARWQKLRSWNHISGPTNPTEHRIAGRYHHLRGVGGSTLHFTGEAHRLHPAAMKMRSRFGVAADWPLDYAELEPFYCEAERIVGVAGPREDPIRTRSEPYPLPAHRFSYASTKIEAGCRKLGFHWLPNSVAALSTPYDGRPACNYCGNCNRGCPIRDKGSVDVTFIRKAVASGYCTVRAGCQVTQVEAGPSDKVARVNYLDGKGESTSVSGQVVIIACGAVETPRLLLASKNRYAPEGLANESGQVGRNFMETIAWTSSGLHREPLDSFRGLPSDGVCWDFNAPDAIPGVTGGCRFSPATAEADLLGPINYARRVVPGWGRKHKTEMKRLFGQALSLKAMGESLPNARSYIDLDPLKRDEAGIPLARIHSDLDEMEIRRLEFMAKKAREILMASGVEKIFEEYGTYDFFNSTHVFGTCRMGNDRRESVVDRYCRSHRWRNLFIVDASVFPSSGGGEAPSLTIEALAIRTSETIRQLANKGEL
ncbi:MAG: GMC family oxidoreductase [Deltaproteobacteria bacterium]|nr:GMC family oxidoreductase [Deltaproteobacteria bacterium]